MKKTDSMKEAMLVNKLKAEDAVELPMDEQFFDNLHNKIMLSVAKTEIKPVKKWEKTWIFLEKKTISQRAKLKKAVKLAITATSITLGAGILNYSLDSGMPSSYANINQNKSSIISEAKKNPVEWSELVINYQNENDFYADVLSQRGSETIVEIDKAIAQSL